MNNRVAVIIGAGPAGLTAAYELLMRTDIVPIVIERDDCMGGISRTVNYKGNRIDLGGHRFFSKSTRVMDWWLSRMPTESPERQADTQDLTMLVRGRKSRIYFDRTFFDYPLGLSLDTLIKLGLGRSLFIGLSYLKSACLPVGNERTLEDFFVNRFGRQLYELFFKSYTEKVWGVPCSQISAEWGAQRIKGLSVWKAIRHALASAMPGMGDLSQKETETTLIDRFLYPKFGPGQMWDEVARLVREKGGRIITNQKVGRVHTEGRRITAVEAVQKSTGELVRYEGDVFFSTMPIRELAWSMGDALSVPMREISAGLMYRDFITVGLLLEELKIRDKSPRGLQAIKDNWIYVQERDVMLGRLQVFNNWSPYMVADASKTWLGLEYFCNETDDLWRQDDGMMARQGAEELERIGAIDRKAVLDWTVLRMPKTYPAYFGTYDKFGELRKRLDRFENLFLVGRNGMHKYNNQDHSMLTAMTAVDNIASGVKDKANIWSVNTEQEYHEE